MKTIFLIGLSASALAACGGGDTEQASDEQQLGSVQQPLTLWIGPVSEESGRNSAVCPMGANGMTMAVKAAFCANSYCDNMYLGCDELPAPWTTIGFNSWSREISEEAPNNSVICSYYTGEPNPPATGYITGISAAGQYADRVSVRCTSLYGAPHAMSCRWTPYFSEEQGFQGFASDEIAAGVRCSGSYCDSMSYYVCRDITLPDILVNPHPSTACGRLLTDEGLRLFEAPLWSCDGRFSLVLNESGLHLNSPDGELWQSGGGKAVSSIMQGDGNFVSYNWSAPLWASGSYGQPGSTLYLQNDGNLVIYNTSGIPVWASNTCCH